MLKPNNTYWMTDTETKSEEKNTGTNMLEILVKLKQIFFIDSGPKMNRNHLKCNYNNTVIHT